MRSTDGINWTLGLPFSSLASAYSPDLGMLIAGDTANGSILNISMNNGAGWFQVANLKPDTNFYRCMEWLPDAKVFIFPQCGTTAGSNFIYTWAGDLNLPFVGGQPIGLNANFGGGTEIYGYFYNPRFRSHFVGYNALTQSLYYAREGGGLPLVNQSLGVGGSLLGTSTYLRPSAAPAPLGASGTSSQLWQNGAQGNALVYSVSGAGYPLAGSTVK
jgi:hypothetical protein